MMKFVYDPEVDILMVYLKRLADGQHVTSTEEMLPGVVADLDEGGNPIQFEILGAAARYGKDVVGEHLISESIVSLAEAGQRAGLSASTLKNQIHAGRLRAKKIGRNWVTTEEWLRDYLIDRREPGRKARVAISRNPIETVTTDR